MGRLDGKVAIITGAGSGQGAEEARMFAREGAKVVATDIQADKVKAVAEEITSNGGEAISFTHDVTKEEEWDMVVRETVDRFGKLDILINNAGIGGAEGFGLIDTIDLNSWNKFMTVNATSNFLGIKAVVPAMRENGKGSIVNISSMAGIVGGAAGVHYTASKGATRLLTKGAAVELGPDNIRVNSIHPGFINTPMTSVVLDDAEMKAGALLNIPLGIVGEPEDVAYLALFLASDESRFVTGAEHLIDGGQTAR
ncbi:SDR family NAD(P)-dependent oxidoreductase [Planococcus sp. CAU13]|uniref:SDR family NAD(P)-dependent oxidoreductase n=1 Tax=Planococcus sp. CAU13 TaxID=1541197 RepID=UPI00052FEBDC|nr:SDR family oxidoreductase [Planococcus sp. CAU13]